ncbi:MAG: TlpA disulfide reductase family protein [Candidatus Bipolaricaulota bacterium]|nr:TlpA disulfide reductase family protein [Candidatus Bipolaricaulota bacterium]
MREAAPWIIAGLVAVLVLALALAPASETIRSAPDFSLKALSGDVVTLSAQRGNVVILDFWASWCKPCTRTLPGLHALAARLSDRGVVLLAVSLDRTEAAARAYAASQDLALGNVLYGSLDEARAVKDLYGVVGIPRTFVIDRDGWVRFSGTPSGVTEELIAAWL